MVDQFFFLIILISIMQHVSTFYINETYELNILARTVVAEEEYVNYKHGQQLNFLFRVDYIIRVLNFKADSFFKTCITRSLDDVITEI